MAEDIQSNIRINVDTAAALANIKNLQGSLSAFYSQMAKSGAAANAVASGLQQNFINSVNMSGKFAASIETIKSSTESFNTALEKNKFSLGEYFKYGVAASKSFGKVFKTEYETVNKVAIERVKDLQTQYVKMGRDANGALRSIAIRPLALDLQDLGTKTQIAAQRQQILNQLLKQGSTNLLNWGKNTQWAGRQLMVGFSIPIGMAGAAAAKAYQQIEEGSIKIRRVYGDMNTTAQETDAMVKKIQNLAAAYTQYGVAVSDTMTMAANAAAMGKTGADLLAQIDQATKLSVLGGVDQQQALDTTISLTNAFGISTSQLADKINYLNSVENQTVLSIEDMTTAIPKAAPIVKQLGGNVEDLAFMLTAMKEGGVNASEGANAIKSGMASLINPTKKASDFLKGFGIDVNGIVQKDKGNLKQTVVDFAKSLDTLDPLNRAKAIEMMFGKFQFSRMSTMLQNITKDGSQASKALELANMSAIQRAAMSRKELDKIQSSPMYKFQKALADFQLKLAPVGEAFLKAITPVVETIGKALDWFNKLGEGTKGMIVKTIGIVGGLAPIILMTVGLVGNGIANILKFLSWIKAAFNKATTASQILGETTDYMTQEQLKAASVAASLDQIHSKLRQTFTSEAEAVTLYTNALKAANAAAGQFVGPTMSFRGGAKKLATGGMVVGPGGPTDDAIPANLSNGEAVIDAATVKKNPNIISALFQGRKINIPGYAKNNSSQFAHVNENVVVTTAKDVLDRILEAEKAGKTVSIKLKQLMEDIVTDIGPGFKVRAYHGLGFDQDAKLNNSMKGDAPVSTDAFIQDFKDRGAAKWNKSISMGGGNLKDKELQQHLAAYDAEITKGLEAFRKLSGGATITSTQFSEIEAAARQTVPEFSQLRQALDTAEAGLYEVRANLSQSVLEKAGIRLEQVPSSKGDGTMSEKKVGAFSSGRYVRASGNRVMSSSKDLFGGIELAELENSGTEVVKEVKKKVVDGVKKSTRQASPSKDAYDAGENIGKGAINALKDEEPKAKAAGEKLAKSITSGVSQSRGAAGRATAAAYSRDPELRNLSIRRKNAQMMGADTAAIDQEIKARRAVVASSVKERLAKERLATVEVQEAKAAVQSGIAKKMTTVGEGIAKLDGKFTKFSSGLTTAAFALSMLPGPIGQIAQVITPVLGVVSLLGSGLELLTKKQAAYAAFTELKALREKGVMAETEMARAVELELIVNENRARGIEIAETGVLAFMMGLLEAPLWPVIAAIAALAAAFAIGVGIFNAINDANKKALEQARRPIKVQQDTKNAMGAFGSLTGSDLSIPTIASVSARNLSKNGKQANDIQTLLSSDDFKNKDSKIAPVISDLKKMGSKSAKSYLTGLAQDFLAGGMDKSAVDSMIKALQIAAGKESLKLTFADIDVTTKKGRADLAKKVAQDVTASGNAELAKWQRGKRVDAFVGSDLGKAKNLTDQQRADLEFFKNADFNSFVGKANAAKASSNNFKQGIADLAAQFGKGIINSKQFGASIGEIAANISKSAQGKANLLNTIGSLGGPTARTAAAGLRNVNDQLMLLTILQADPTKGQNIVSGLMSNNAGKIAQAKKDLKAYGDIFKIFKQTYTTPDTSNNSSGANKVDVKAPLKDMRAAAAAAVLGKQLIRNKDITAGMQEIIAGMDKKTRDYYGYINKNGVFTLKAAGKALKEAYDKKVIQEALNSVSTNVKNFRAQIGLQTSLKSLGFSIADAAKLSADSMWQEAWASANTKKKRDAILAAMRQQISLQGEIDANQKLIDDAAQAASDAAAEAAKSTEEKAMDAAQARLDSANAELSAAEAKFGMEAKQNKLAMDNQALEEISRKEDAINKTYDERTKALDEIQKAQEAISQAQQDQLDVASAITTGDMAAAARAVQQARKNSADRAMQDQKDALDTAHQRELDSIMVSVNGTMMTRKQIEADILAIEQSIYNFESSQAILAIKANIAARTDEYNAAKAVYDMVAATKALGSVTPIPAPAPDTSLDRSEKARFALIHLQSSGADALSDEERALLGMAPKSATSSSSTISTTTKPLVQAPAGLQFLPKDELAKMGYYANGGFIARGSDTVPAMLTPGEFIMSRSSVKKYGSGLMDSINAGNFEMPSYSATPQISQVSPVNNNISSNVDNSSVYNNSYSVNIHTTGSQDTDSIARAVIGKIREYDSQRVRGVRV